MIEWSRWSHPWVESYVFTDIRMITFEISRSDQIVESKSIELLITCFINSWKFWFSIRWQVSDCKGQLILISQSQHICSGNASLGASYLRHLHRTYWQTWEPSHHIYSKTVWMLLVCRQAWTGSAGYFNRQKLRQVRNRSSRAWPCSWLLAWTYATW